MRVPGRLSMAESNTFNTKISNNITPLGTYRYTCHHLSKTSFGLRQNVRSSGHEHSSAGRLWEEFTYRIERLTQSLLPRIRLDHLFISTHASWDRYSVAFLGS